MEIKPKTFHKILVGVDNAPDALAAFDYAVDKAKRDGSELGIVSVYETHNVNVFQILDKNRFKNTFKQRLIMGWIPRRLP